MSVDAGTLKWLIGIGGAALLVEIWRTGVGFVKFLYGKKHTEHTLPGQMSRLEDKVDALGSLYDKQYQETKQEFSKINAQVTKIEKVLDRNGEGTAVSLKVSQAILLGLQRHGYELNGEGKEAEEELNSFLLSNTQQGLRI